VSALAFRSNNCPLMTNGSDEACIVAPQVFLNLPRERRPSLMAVIPETDAAMFWKSSRASGEPTSRSFSTDFPQIVSCLLEEIGTSVSRG